MRDEDGAEGAPDGVAAPKGAQPQPTGDQSRNDAAPSATDGPPVGDGDLLTGSVPPEEEAAEIPDTATRAEAPAATPVSDVTKTRRLARWGPYKRWSWYREIRKAREESPRWDDAKENEQGKLPADEAVDIPAIWVAELYTPSTVSGLLDGITKLGWEHGRSPDRSLLKWMSDIREGRRAGWTSLGLVSPKAKPHFARDREATLPEGIAVAFPMLMSLTPGITALVIAWPAVKRAGVGHLRFHDLRHTSAALAIAAGAHPKTIQMRLGHHSAAFTLDVYGGLFEGLDEDLADRFDERAPAIPNESFAEGEAQVIPFRSRPQRKSGSERS